jgi:1,5-anhydro-D-fructose reductase (1,5-anhydro-D-mannitol-forming)
VNKVIKIGVVGCGQILTGHLHGFKALRDAGFDNFRITALCELKLENARIFRKRGEGPPPHPTKAVTGSWGPHLYVSDIHDDVVPALYTDWREMLAAAEVDAVLILTPIFLHHQVALESLMAGKHVLAEKPLAVSVRAGQRMVEEARARGLSLGVGEAIRYREETRTRKWVLDSGQIGFVQMWLSGRMGDREWSPDLILGNTPWRHRKLEAGGGLAVDAGVHLFSEIRYLCGEIEELSAMAARLEPLRVSRDESGRVTRSVECDVEDTYFAHLKFANGAIGSIFGGAAGHGEPTAIEDGPAIYGSKGCIKSGDVILDGGERTAAKDLFAERAPTALGDSWFPRGVRDRFALEQLDFLRSIETGRPMETDGEEGVRDLACAFGLLESATLNRPVKIAEVLDGKVDAYQREINEHYGL